MDKAIDTIIPLDRWQFNGDVAGCFTDMISRSIPGYESMRDSVFYVGSEIINRNIQNNIRSVVVDLGCSNGLSIQPFVNKYCAFLRCFLYDTSEQMIEQCRGMYKNLLDTDVMTIEKRDISQCYPLVMANITLSILTLQFTPIEVRQKILHDIYEHTTPNGALVIVEKVQGTDWKMDDMLTKLYYDSKRRNGYSDEQIMKKRKSLSGVLIPLKASWNEALLREAGFSHVECFWRHYNFAGWIAVK